MGVPVSNGVGDCGGVGVVGARTISGGEIPGLLALRDSGCAGISVD